MIRKFILANGNNTEVEFMKCDLSSFESVVKCAEDIKRLYPISILINNAGSFPSSFYRTTNGQELLYQTTYLSHFLLTTLLWDTLNENGPSRVVWVSSALHKIAKSPMLPPGLNKVYNGLEAYSRAKLAIIMSVHEWHRRFVATGSNVVINSIDPGVVATNILRDFPFAIGYIYSSLCAAIVKSADQGAESLVYAALAPQAGKMSSRFISACQDRASSDISYDIKLESSLWTHTEKSLRPYISRALMKEAGMALM